MWVVYLYIADHVFPVRSGVWTPVIRKMLMGMTVMSPSKASNVALIRRHPEDVIHSTQMLHFPMKVYSQTYEHRRASSASPTSSSAPSKIFLNGASHSLAHQILNIHVYSCWFEKKKNIISCLIDRHFDGHAHKATLMLSLVMLLWWPKDGSLSRRIQ